ncbi:hypothetical protein STEG23_009476, partial [Scotinomys teguina]
MNSRKNCLSVAWVSISDPSYELPVVVEHTGFLKDVFISSKQVFEDIFSYDFVEDLISDIDFGLFSLIYAYNLKVWTFHGPTF